MRKVKIAMIGVNYYSHATQICRSLHRQSDIFDLVGVCLPEGESARLPDRVAALPKLPELSLDQILNDPAIEAVAVETDEIYLTKYALLAAAHGKHIHMEKPGGRELSDFETLINTMKSTGKVFHTGYMYRYNPAVTALLAQVKSGALGDIISVEAQMNCTHPAAVRGAGSTRCRRA